MLVTMGTNRIVNFQSFLNAMKWAEEAPIDEKMKGFDR